MSKKPTLNRVIYMLLGTTVTGLGGSLLSTCIEPSDSGPKHAQLVLYILSVVCVVGAGALFLYRFALTEEAIENRRQRQSELERKFLWDKYDDNLPSDKFYSRYTNTDADGDDWRQTRSQVVPAAVNKGFADKLEKETQIKYGFRLNLSAMLGWAFLFTGAALVAVNIMFSQIIHLLRPPAPLNSQSSSSSNPSIADPLPEMKANNAHASKKAIRTIPQQTVFPLPAAANPNAK